MKRCLAISLLIMLSFPYQSYATVRRPLHPVFSIINVLRNFQNYVQLPSIQLPLKDRKHSMGNHQHLRSDQPKAPSRVYVPFDRHTAARLRYERLLNVKPGRHE